MAKRNQSNNNRGGNRQSAQSRALAEQQARLAAWKPKTEIGKQVRQGTITDIKHVIEKGKVVLEAEIVDILLPNVQNDLLLIGQSKGKFGGGQKRVFRQTQKKTREGNKPSFSTYAVVGNGDGYVGLGYGKAKETVPAREKAVRNAKLNLIQVARGAGDWESESKEPHTIPFKVSGKCGSVEITLMPAPVGTGLVIEKECAKILKMAGIQNVRSTSKGSVKTKTNMIKACFAALKQLTNVKVKAGDVEKLSLLYGAQNKVEAQQPVGEANE